MSLLSLVFESLSVIEPARFGCCVLFTALNTPRGCFVRVVSFISKYHSSLYTPHMISGKQPLS